MDISFEEFDNYLFMIEHNLLDQVYHEVILEYLIKEIYESDLEFKQKYADKIPMLQSKSAKLKKFDEILSCIQITKQLNQAKLANFT